MNRYTIQQLQQMRESEDHVEFKKGEGGNVSYNGSDKANHKSRRKCIQPSGRPPKEPHPVQVMAKMAKAARERNKFECSFGTDKRIYRTNNIRDKLLDSGRCWTELCYFVKNVMKFLRDFVLHRMNYCPGYCS